MSPTDPWVPVGRRVSQPREASLPKGRSMDPDGCRWWQHPGADSSLGFLLPSCPFGCLSARAAAKPRVWFSSGAGLSLIASPKRTNVGWAHLLSTFPGAKSGQLAQAERTPHKPILGQQPAPSAGRGGFPFKVPPFPPGESPVAAAGPCQAPAAPGIRASPASSHRLQPLQGRSLLLRAQECPRVGAADPSPFSCLPDEKNRECRSSPGRSLLASRAVGMGCWTPKPREGPPSRGWGAAREWGRKGDRGAAAPVLLRVGAGAVPSCFGGSCSPAMRFWGFPSARQ